MNFRHFMKILQHVPEKVLMSVKITSTKKTPEKKRHQKEFQKGGNMNSD